MVARLGLGKVRHLSVSDLWVQQAARDQVIRYHKIDGTRNPADMLTKAIESDVIRRHLHQMGFYSAEGRAKSAPKGMHGEVGKKGRAAGEGGSQLVGEWLWVVVFAPSRVGRRVLSTWGLKSWCGQNYGRFAPKARGGAEKFAP